MQPSMLSRVIAAGAFLVATIASGAVVERQTDTFCSDNYGESTEHFKTCDEYSKREYGKRVIVPKDADLNDAVDKASADDLLIIPARGKDNPYLLKAPLN